MALFNLFGAETRSTSLENPSVGLNDASAWRGVFNDGFKGFTDEEVNESTALGVPAIWAAVDTVAGSIASLPLHVYRNTADGPVPADGDPVYSLLHTVVNDDLLTTSQWRRWVITRLMLEGRAVCWIERNGANKAMNIWPLDLSTVTIKKVDGRTVYERKRKTRNAKTGLMEDTFAAVDVLDFVWTLKADGFSHINPIQQHRNAIGLTIACERYAASNFASGGVPPAVATMPAGSPAAMDRAATEISNRLKSGARNRDPVMTLPTGVEIKAIGLNHTQQQMIEARKLQITEIARIWKIPPSFLQDLSTGTFSNVEQQDLAFVKHTLMPWLTMIEQELNAKLFGRKSTNYAEFNTLGMLRADLKTQAESLRSLTTAGVYTINEARAYLGKAAIKGGDQPLIQGAMVPLNMAGQHITNKATPTTEPGTPDDTGDQDQ
jgi:HK97 family phage portal protein